MSRWDRIMLCSLLTLGMALAPLIYAHKAARMLACAATTSAASLSVTDHHADEPMDACAARGACHRSDANDQSEERSSDDSRSAPKCDMSLCCAATRAPATFDTVSIPLPTLVARLTLPDANLFLSSRSLRPDPPPPRV